MSDDGYLDGQLIVAMPGMGDPRFEHTVIYMCAHSDEGAMGLMVNKLVDHISFPDLMEQLNIDAGSIDNPIEVHFGGPVEESRGFVLHSVDYQQEGTMPIDDSMALTASVDVLKAIAESKGPERCLLALGYAGWSPGQLDNEIQANGWLHVHSDDDLVFGRELETKWSRAVAKIGIDLALLSSSPGHA